MNAGIIHLSSSLEKEEFPSHCCQFWSSKYSGQKCSLHLSSLADPSCKQTSIRLKPKAFWERNGISQDKDQVAIRSPSEDRGAFMQMLKSCGEQKNLSRARKLQSVAKDLIPKDLYVTTAVLSMLAKCGAVEEASKLFDEIHDRNIVCWNSHISGHVHNGQAEIALKCFMQMLEESIAPDVVTLTCVLKACGAVGSLKVGKEIHALIEAQGLLEKDVVLGNTLVNMYCKCGLLEYASNLLERLPERNAPSWTALIAGYAQYGDGHEALKCFQQMQNEGIVPDRVSFICMLKACGTIGSLKIGQEIHTEVKNQRLLEKDIVLGTALVDMYSKCGAFEKAQKTLEELPVRNVVTWSALISGYAQHGLSIAAVTCYKKMKEEGLVPDSVTYICVLMACGAIGSLRIGEEIHAETKEHGLLERDIALDTTLLHMYAKCGVLEKAHQVFEMIPKKDVVSWNALMDAYAQMGHVKAVFYLFDKISSEDIVPNLVSFLILLNACCHAGLLKEGKLIFVHMCDVYAHTPELEHFTCMADLFGRAGYFDGVTALLHALQSVEHLPLFSAVLGSCHKWVNVELGLWAFKKLIELDTKCGAAYACMRNIYSAAGMYGEAVKVESLRKKNQMWNIVGCCWWIDIDWNVHLFNKDYPHGINISSNLGNIQRRMSQEHYSAGSKEDLPCGHYEKLAIECALIKTPKGIPINLIKSTRVCYDCHQAMLLISITEKQKIHVKDASRVHIFWDGHCICQYESKHF